MSGTNIIETFMGQRCLWDVRLRILKKKKQKTNRFNGFLTGQPLALTLGRLKTATQNKQYVGTEETLIQWTELPLLTQVLWVFILGYLNTKLDNNRGLSALMLRESHKTKL